MTDNELFNHFKSRSISFDEMPGDALWAKIESGLENTKSSAKPNTLLLIICGIVLVAGISFYALFKTDKENIPLPARPHTIHETAVDNPTIAPEATTPVEFTVSTATDSVKKIRIRVINTSDTKTIPFTQIIKKDSVNQDIIAPKTVDIKVQTPPGKVIVTTTQQLNREEFKELTESITEQHKTELGIMLIIKAAGHKPFRKVITQQDALLQPAGINLIQPTPINLIQPGSRDLLKADTVKLNTNGKSQLSPETIRFRPIKNNTKAIQTGGQGKGQVITEEELDSL